MSHQILIREIILKKDKKRKDKHTVATSCIYCYQIRHNINVTQTHKNYLLLNNYIISLQK